MLITHLTFAILVGSINKKKIIRAPVTEHKEEKIHIKNIHNRLRLIPDNISLTENNLQCI